MGRAAAALAAALALVALVTACTAVKDEFRCTDSNGCVLEGRYGGRCEDNGYCSFGDVSCEGLQRYGPWSGPYSDLCVGELPPGDPPDARETNPSGNDDPSSPWVLNGPDEVVTFDLDAATVAAQSTYCDDRGQPDLFYTFSLFQEEVVYLEAVGSGAALTVTSGGCADPIPPDGGRILCGDKSCQDGVAQLAEDLAPDRYCVTLTGYGQGTLRYLRGQRAGIAANPGANVVDTCDAMDLTRPSCSPGAGEGVPEAAFFLAACAGHLTAVTGDSALVFVRRGSAFSGDLACGNDGAGVETQRGLYWVFVEAGPICLSGAQLSINW